MLVDMVANHLFSLLLFGSFELGRHEESLDLVKVSLCVVEVHQLWLGLGDLWRAWSHGLVHHLLGRRSHLVHELRLVLMTHWVWSSTSLEVGSLVHITSSLIHSHLVWHWPTTHRCVHTKVVHRSRSILWISLVELEGWFQKKGQKVDEILLTSQTSKLGLSLLVLFLVLRLLVEQLLVP